MIDYLLVTGERLTGNDPRIFRVVGADALPPDVEASEIREAIERAMFAPRVTGEVVEVVVIYAAGHETRGDRAVRARAVRPGCLRLAMRALLERLTSEADTD